VSGYRFHPWNSNRRVATANTIQSHATKRTQSCDLIIAGTSTIKVQASA
jgi:hypothetical protein